MEPPRTELPWSRLPWATPCARPCSRPPAALPVTGALHSCQANGSCEKLAGHKVMGLKVPRTLEMRQSSGSPGST